MSTSTLETVRTNDEYKIVAGNGAFYVTKNGEYLYDERGNLRLFTSRNSARKRIARERSGNFHK